MVNQLTRLSVPVSLCALAGGLSAGAIAGIAVSVFAVLAVATAAALLFVPCGASCWRKAEGADQSAKTSRSLLVDEYGEPKDLTKAVPLTGSACVCDNTSGSMSASTVEAVAGNRSHARAALFDSPHIEVRGSLAAIYPPTCESAYVAL